jgi:cellobiose-specific phosphotransferase system component IIA
LSTKLQSLLSLLSDNVWHNIDETAKILEIPQKRFRQVIALLTEKNLVQHNRATNQIRLSHNWKTLLINQKETQEQPTATVGTIIIPPQKTLMIQSTRITNLTDTSLELNVSINKKIREIAINKIK